MSRRDTIKALTSLAAARWRADEDIDEPISEWPPLNAHSYVTAELTPEALTTSGHGPAANWRVTTDRFTDETITVRYSRDGIQLAADGRTDDIHAGSTTDLTTDQARTLAVALFQAAVELDCRRTHEAAQRTDSSDDAESTEADE